MLLSDISANSAGKQEARVKRTYGSSKGRSTAISDSHPAKRARRSAAGSSSPQAVSGPTTSSAASSSSPNAVLTPVSGPDCNALVALSPSSSPIARRPGRGVLPGRCSINKAKGTTNSLQPKNSKSSLASGLAAPPLKKLEQLHLTLSAAPLNSVCPRCAMHYMRGAAEDERLHKAYCSKVSRGIEWPFRGASGVHVLQEAMTLRRKGDAKGKGRQIEGTMVTVEGSVKGALRKKLEEIASTVDDSLSAASMSEHDFSASRFLLFLEESATGKTGMGTQRVAACAVVSRISEAFRVIAAEQAAGLSSTTLLRFGEDDGAMFCSPMPVPAILGIHRIWTSPAHRQLGIAQRLLDAAAKHAVYGCDIPLAVRKDKIAFSQPSSAGQRLFTAWTGTSNLLLFVD